MSKERESERVGRGASRAVPAFPATRKAEKKMLFLCYLCYNLPSVEMSTFGKREPVTVLKFIRSVVSQSRTKQAVK